MGVGTGIDVSTGVDMGATGIETGEGAGMVGVCSTAGVGVMAASEAGFSDEGVAVASETGEGMGVRSGAPAEDGVGESASESVLTVADSRVGIGDGEGPGNWPAGEAEGASGVPIVMV